MKLNGWKLNRSAVVNGLKSEPGPKGSLGSNGLGISPGANAFFRVMSNPSVPGGMMMKRPSGVPDEQELSQAVA
jgi:hypothetical protein